jgi:hypothetical protein
MACLLYVDDEETNRKINIDDLYERRKMRDQKQLSIFNKILNRVHRRITHIGRNKANDKHIWFTVPEYLFGEPVYDKSDCIGYLVSKLQDNGFYVKYVHPNTLFVSWNEWIPQYVRSEFRKKTGITIDERGNIVDKPEGEDLNVNANDPNARMLNAGGDKANAQKSNNKNFTPINTYKPSGNMVYNPEIFEKLEKKVSFA